MTTPPDAATDTATYKYYTYACTPVRVTLDSQGRPCAAEYVDRHTGELTLDHTYISKIAFDWNAEAEDSDAAHFARLHDQMLRNLLHQKQAQPHVPENASAIERLQKLLLEHAAN